MGKSDVSSMGYPRVGQRNGRREGNKLPKILLNSEVKELAGSPANAQILGRTGFGSGELR
jgi:hypothetical protein